MTRFLLLILIFYFPVLAIPYMCLIDYIVLNKIPTIPQIILSIILIFVAIIYTFRFKENKKNDFYVGITVTLLLPILLLTFVFFKSFINDVTTSIIKCNKVENSCTIEQRNSFFIILNKSEFLISNIDNVYINTYQLEHHFCHHGCKKYYTTYYDINVKQNSDEQKESSFSLNYKKEKDAEKTLQEFKDFLKDPQKNKFSHRRNDIGFIFLAFAGLIFNWIIILCIIGTLYSYKKNK